MEKTRLLQAIGFIRRFLYKSLIIVAIGSIGSFIYAKDIAYLLVKVVNIKTYYLSLPEVLFSSLEIAFFGGIFFTMPIIALFACHDLRDIIGFKLFHRFVFIASGVILFYTGCLFCYFIVLPSGIKFLLSYESEPIRAMISIEKFVIFCTTMIFAFGATFEVPIVLFLLGKMGIVKSTTLGRTRRYAILIITIASAIITPTPDIYNMMLLVVPMYILYEIGIILIKIVEKRKGQNHTS